MLIFRRQRGQALVLGSWTEFLRLGSRCTPLDQCLFLGMLGAALDSATDLGVRAEATCSWSSASLRTPVLILFNSLRDKMVLSICVRVCHRQGFGVHVGNKVLLFGTMVSAPLDHGTSRAVPRGLP